MRHNPMFYSLGGHKNSVHLKKKDAKKRETDTRIETILIAILKYEIVPIQTLLFIIEYLEQMVCI